MFANLKNALKNNHYDMKLVASKYNLAGQILYKTRVKSHYKNTF